MKMSVLNVFNDFSKFACRSRSTRAPLSPSAAEISTLRAASAPLSLPPATTGGGRLHAASPCVPPMVRHGHARQARGVSLFDPPQPMGKGSAVRSHHVCRRRHVAVAQANFTPPSLRYRLPAAAGGGQRRTICTANGTSRSLKMSTLRASFASLGEGAAARRRNLPALAVEGKREERVHATCPPLARVRPAVGGAHGAAARRCPPSGGYGGRATRLFCATISIQAHMEQMAREVRRPTEAAPRLDTFSGAPRAPRLDTSPGAPPAPQIDTSSGAPPAP